LIIYSDGQTIFGDKENRPYSFLQTYLDPSQMCDLKRDVQEIGFLEPPELGRYYTQTETGVGATHFIVQLENIYYSFYEPNIQYLIDYLQLGFMQIANFRPPEPYEPYVPKIIALAIDNIEPDTDDLIEEWPDNLPSITELGFEEGTYMIFIEGDLVLPIFDLFEGHLTAKFFREGENIYRMSHYPLLPHETVQNYDDFPRRPRDYVSLLNCKDKPTFISPLIPTVTPTLTASSAKLTGKGRILFVSDADGDREIYIMETDGTSRFRLTNNQFNDHSPTLSPDGSQIAFVSDRTGSAEIFVMDANGTNVVQLTFNNSGDYAPSWAPDGFQIAFVSDRDNGWEQSQIYLMNSDGSQQQRITHNEHNNSYPRWSANGQTIIFSQELNFQEYQTAFVDLNDNGVEQVLDLGINSDLEGVVESHDGSMFAGGKELENGDQEIQILSKDGTLIESFPIRVNLPSSFGWTYNSEFIIFGGYLNGQRNIFALELATGDVFPLTYTQHDEFSIALWP
jgi:hypothetical protein